MLTMPLARSRRLLLALSMIALMTIAGGLGYQRYLLATEASRSAQAHLNIAEAQIRELAKNPAGLDARRAETIVEELDAARVELGVALAEVGRLRPLLRVISDLPAIGNNARAADHLLEIADYGLRGWDESREPIQVLLGAITDQGDARGSERLPKVTQAVRLGLEKASATIGSIRGAYQGIPREGLFPPLASSVDLLGKGLATASKAVETANESSEAASAVLGIDGERVYLVLVQDTGEIRPTGGFIGNYGIVKVSQGRMVEQKFADAYDLDWPYYYSGQASPPVAMFKRYFPESTFWALRDSNLWPDFPTSATQAARFAIAEGATDRVDGVIAFTPALAGRLLRVVGPVTVPGFDEVITDQNFEERIRYYQYHAIPESVQKRLGAEFERGRKLFTSLLIRTLIEKLNALDAKSTFALIPALQEAVREKDLLAYFEDPRLQALVERYGLSGDAKPATGDYLWIVDMNLSASKDNLYVHQTAQYTVTIAPHGGANAELEITYDYQRTGDLYLFTIKRGYYGDYLRVYAPPGSVLRGSDGVDEEFQTVGEHGKTVFETFLRIYPSTTRTVKLCYWVPFKIWPDDPERKYELLVQKQPASNIKALGVKVILPEGSIVTNRQNLTGESNILEYRGPLSSDLSLAADFKLP